MKEITSTTNQIIKDTVKLHLKKYRSEFILIEGKKAVDEAISAGLCVKHIFLKNPEGYEKYDPYVVSNDVMSKISTTESAPTIAMVAKKPVYNIEDFKKFKKIVLLDNVKDAGNLGTIIRAGAAFGVDGILLVNDTVDEFSPKTIRSCAGNRFKIPILKTDLKKLAEFKQTHRFYATVCHGDNYLEKKHLKENSIIMFGSEADGLCEDLLNFSDENITIKLSKNVESLNLAISAAVVLYELQ